MSCNCKDAEIKQGTRLGLSVLFEGDDDFTLDDIYQIEFVFKQRRSVNADVIKTSVWKSNETGDATRIDGTNVIVVPFAREETYAFKPDEKFYMDTRLLHADSLDNLLTQIVELTMSATLFGEVDPND